MSKYSQDRSYLSQFVDLVKKWIILEPSIFLFLMSARMVYFTRQNLFLDVVCMEMADTKTCLNMTQVRTDRLTVRTQRFLPGVQRQSVNRGGRHDLRDPEDREHRPHPPLRPQRPRVGQVRAEAAAPGLLPGDVGLLHRILRPLRPRPRAQALPPPLHPPLHRDLRRRTVLRLLPDVLRLHQRRVGVEPRERRLQVPEVHHSGGLRLLRSRDGVLCRRSDVL